MRFRSLFSLALGLVLIAASLTGCGQKGPLVLPKSQVTSAASVR